MTQILYLSHFDNTGYGQASVGYVNALEAAGYDVVCRQINLNGTKAVEDENIQENLKKRPRNCNVVIQHTLPEYFDYNGNYKKNIGLFVWEASNLIGTNWAKYCNNMDEIWTANELGKNALLKSKCKVPVKIIPHAFDINKYNQNYVGYDVIKNIKKEGNLGEDEPPFIFYTINEFTSRKNLADLIKAYHITFKPDDNVKLVIKTNQGGVSSEELNRKVRELCTNVKKGLKLYGNNLNYYQDEVIITDRLTENQINQLHQDSDCFVTTSRGEGFGQTAFDAMAFGKTPIVPENAGYDFIWKNTGYTVRTFTDNCYEAFDTMPDLYNGFQKWKNIVINDLSYRMLEVYNNRKTLNHTRQNGGKIKAYNYSYDKVGELMKEALTV